MHHIQSSDHTPPPRKHKRLELSLLGLVLLILLGSSSYVIATQLPDRLTWTPATLTLESLAPGDSMTYQVTMKNSGYLPIRAAHQLEVVATDDLAPYVSIVQPTFPHRWFRRGEEVTVAVTVSAPPDAPVGVYEGELLLQRAWRNQVGEVWRANPLLVELAFAPARIYEDPDERFSFVVPTNLSIVEDADVDLVRLVRTDNAQIVGHEAPNVSLEVLENPGNLDIEDYFDGDPGFDLVNTSSGSYATITVDGLTAYKYAPWQSLAGEIIVVIPFGERFYVISDVGAAHQADGSFDFIIASLSIGG
jgi:hypothetical protein